MSEAPLQEVKQPDAPSPSEPTDDQLMVEYQAAQDSAQHHDNLIWSITSIMWGASLVLLGFIIQAVANPALASLIVAATVLGILLNLCVLLAVLQLNSVKNQKYDRCKEIEARFGLRQHQTVQYRRGVQRVVYTLVTVMFLIAWGTVLQTVHKSSAAAAPPNRPLQPPAGAPSAK